MWLDPVMSHLFDTSKEPVNTQVVLACYSYYKYYILYIFYSLLLLLSLLFFKYISEVLCHHLLTGSLLHAVGWSLTISQNCMQ